MISPVDGFNIHKPSKPTLNSNLVKTCSPITSLLSWNFAPHTTTRPWQTSCCNILHRARYLVNYVKSIGVLTKNVIGKQDFAIFDFKMRFGGLFYTTEICSPQWCVCPAYLDKCMYSQIARFMGPIWGPSGAYRTQLGPRWAPGGSHELCFLGWLRFVEYDCYKKRLPRLISVYRTLDLCIDLP